MAEIAGSAKGGAGAGTGAGKGAGADKGAVTGRGTVTGVTRTVYDAYVMTQAEIHGRVMVESLKRGIAGRGHRLRGPPPAG